MDEIVRQWLLEKLESWLSTWDDLGEHEGETEPEMLRKIVESLRNGYTKFTREAYNEILFHLWQIAQGKETEND